MCVAGFRVCSGRASGGRQPPVFESLTGQGADAPFARNFWNRLSRGSADPRLRLFVIETPESVGAFATWHGPYPNGRIQPERGRIKGASSCDGGLYCR